MVMIKAPVSGWHEVTVEQALVFARAVVCGAWCGTTIALDYVNKNMLRGVTFTAEDIRHGIRN